MDRDTAYRNEIARKLRKGVNKAYEVNKDEKFAERVEYVNNQWAKRENETKDTPRERKQFAHDRIIQTLNEIPKEDLRDYRLQGL